MDILQLSLTLLVLVIGGAVILLVLLLKLLLYLVVCGAIVWAVTLPFRLLRGKEKRKLTQAPALVTG